MSVDLWREHLCVPVYCLGVFTLGGGAVFGCCLCVSERTARAPLGVGSAGLHLGVYMDARVCVSL